LEHPDSGRGARAGGGVNDAAAWLAQNPGTLALRFSSKRRACRLTSASGAQFLAEDLPSARAMFTAAAAAGRRLWSEDAATMDREHASFLTELGWPRISDALTADRALAPEYRKPTPAPDQALAQLMHTHNAAPAVERQHAQWFEEEDAAWREVARLGYRLDKHAFAEERQSRHEALAAFAREHGVDVRRSDAKKAVFLDRIGVGYTRTKEYGWAQPRNCDVTNMAVEHADVWAAYTRAHSTLKRVQILDGMRPLVDAGGRIHPLIRTNEARTGRMSVSNPAMQGVMKELRYLFLTEPERPWMISVDHASAEMKILAAYLARTGESSFTRKVMDTDIYGSLAARTGLTRADEKWRLVAFSYNQQESSLARLVGAESAARTHAAIHELFPEVAAFRDEQTARSQRGEQLFTLDGRRLPRLSGGKDDRHSKASNLLIQGGARDQFGKATRAAIAAGLHLAHPMHDEIFCTTANPATDAAHLIEAMTVDLGYGISLSGTATVTKGRWAPPPAKR
jgi:hypothetical protein